MARRKPAPPPVLPGYTFVRPLGSGGFADVFLYEQDMPRRVVAVKVLCDDAINPDVLRTFNSEGDILARLSTHASIVTIFHSSISGRRPALLRHGLLPRHDGRQSQEEPPSRRRCSRRWRADRRGARDGPPIRSAAQRHQALQHSGDNSRHPRACRLRHRSRRDPDRRRCRRRRRDVDPMERTRGHFPPRLRHGPLRNLEPRGHAVHLAHRKGPFRAPLWREDLPGATHATDPQDQATCPPGGPTFPRASSPRSRRRSRRTPRRGMRRCSPSPRSCGGFNTSSECPPPPSRSRHRNGPPPQPPSTSRATPHVDPSSRPFAKTHEGRYAPRPSHRRNAPATTRPTRSVRRGPGWQ